MRAVSPLERLQSLAAVAASSDDAAAAPSTAVISSWAQHHHHQQASAAARATPPLPVLGVGGAAEIRVLEVDAFASVQDLIHAAIAGKGGAASLKDVYELCRRSGRIAYKRAGGSRLITSGLHWKSQIRHALYTGDRFQRVPASNDLWQLTPRHASAAAQIVRVLVRAQTSAVSGGAAGASAPRAGGVRAAPPSLALAATSSPSDPASATRSISGAKRSRPVRRHTPCAGGQGAGVATEEESGVSGSAVCSMPPAAAQSPCPATPPQYPGGAGEGPGAAAATG